MNEDFVTYELAVKLKEKGFNEPCFGWYYSSEVCGLDYKTTIVFNNSAYRGSNYKDMLVSHKDEKHIDAPTISQVLKWLREEKKIYIVIAVNPTLSTKDKIAYYYQVYSNSNGETSDYYESEECYAQWEDCAIDSIKYVLDELI